MTFRTEQFKKELTELCQKYNCSIEADDHFNGYGECERDIRITVYFNSYTNVDYIPSEELDLGSNFDGK